MATNPNTIKEIRIISKIISNIKLWGKKTREIKSRQAGLIPAYELAEWVAAFDEDVLSHFDFLKNYEFRDGSGPNAKKLELEELFVAKSHLMDVRRALLSAKFQNLDIKQIFVHLSKAIVELKKLKGMEIRLG